MIFDKSGNAIRSFPLPLRRYILLGCYTYRSANTDDICLTEYDKLTNTIYHVRTLQCRISQTEHDRFIVALHKKHWHILKKVVVLQRVKLLNRLSKISQHNTTQSISDAYLSNKRAEKVDFVLVKNSRIVAIEVKSNDTADTAGLHRFEDLFHPHRSIFVGSNGISLETFLSSNLTELFE